MSGPGASLGEMPEIPISRRAAPELDEQILDAVLAGRHLPPDAPGPAHVVAELLASLTVPADSGDLAGEAAARRAFSRAASPAFRRHGHRAAARRRSLRPASAGARLVAVLTVASAALGGTAAAYAGALPASVQAFAHRTIGAPAPRRPAAHASHRRPVGYRLCTAYERAEAAGHPRALAGAARRLTVAAGGTDSIGAYCARAGRPGVLPPGSAGREPGEEPRGQARGHHKPWDHRPDGPGQSNGNGNGEGQGKGKGQGNGQGGAEKSGNSQGDGQAGKTSSQAGKTSSQARKTSGQARRASGDGG